MSEKHGSEVLAPNVEDPIGAAVGPGSEGTAEPAPPPEDEVTPRARRAVGLSLRTTATLQFLAMITGVELARGLGLDDRGALAAAMLWPLVIGDIATLGIEESMTYNIARAPERAGRFLGSGLLVFCLQAPVFWALSAAIVPLALSSHGSDVIVPALIYTLYVPINMFGLVFLGTLNGLHRYEWFNQVRLAVGLFLVVMQTILLIVGPFTVMALVIGMVVAYIATDLVAIWLVWRARPGRISADRQTMREIFGFGIRSHSSFTASLLNQRLGQLVVSVFLSASDLGLYVVAVTFTSLTFIIGGSFAYATLPNVASLPEGEGRTKLARQLVSLTLLLSFLLSLPMFLFAPQLISAFFGSAFSAAGDITRILLIGTVALSTNRALEAVLRAGGRPLSAGMAELFALGATIVGTAILLPLFDLDGAAIASSIAYITATVWMTRKATRMLDVPARKLLIADRDTLSAMFERFRKLREMIAARRAARNAA
jgi:O-antigen/teichoic acid export membrane protein